MTTPETTDTADHDLTLGLGALVGRGRRHARRGRVGGRPQRSAGRTSPLRRLVRPGAAGGRRRLRLQRLAAPAPDLGDRFYATFDFLPELSDQCIDVLAAQAPRAGVQVIVVPFGGAVARLPQDATAFGHRSERFGLNIIAQWADPAQDDRHTAGARTLARAIRAFTTGGGVYLNATSDEDPGVVQAAFGPAAWRRLTALKDRYDPDNVFRLNHNIPPSTTAAGSVGRYRTGGAQPEGQNVPRISWIEDADAQRRARRAL